jgi:SPP1 gp7 family putative phage head morphogenesis protein
MTITVAEVQRLVSLRQYENAAAREVQAAFDLLRKDLVALLEKYPLDAVRPAWRERRLAALLKEADALINDFYRDIALKSRTALVDLGQLMSTSRAKTLAGQGLRIALKLPTRLQIRAILSTSPIQGAVMRTWWAGQSVALRQQFSQQIRMGMLGGDTLGEMINRIRGTPIGEGRYDGGIMATSKRKAETLVRTSVNHIHSAADQLLYKANSDLVEEYEIFATLDTRTTILCASLDGQRFKVNDPEGLKPPFHWGCRTTTIPVVNYAALGLPQPERTRQTYEEWFAKQPLKTQELILGPTRAALVRKGEASFSDLLRSDGRTLSLEGLRAKLK